MTKTFQISCVMALAAAAAATAARGDVELPPGFKADVLVEGIDAATTLTIAPDGRVFYAEQTGAIRVVKNGELLPDSALDLHDRLDSWWERGLIGMTLHPDFPRTPYIFLVYVAKEPYSHHVASRFTVVGDIIDPASELKLVEGDDQETLGGKVRAGHQGGPICFGSDGMLYIGLGEQTAGEPSQSLATLQGKILRLHPDGSIPEDNPFYHETDGKYGSIYAIGIRNPFGLAVEPATGRLFETDVGSSAFEEINEIVAGGNYGWPHAEGISDKPGFIDPIHAYPPVVGRSICGAMFYPEDGSFPAEWHGKLFFTDWADHWVKAIDVDDPEKLIPFGDRFDAPVGIAAAPDGSVYVLNRGTRWRDGKEFKERSGSLVHIRYGDGSDIREKPARPPSLASTGVFGDVANLAPASGFVPFEVNAPPWLPGATAKHWIRIPEGQRIETAEDAPWQLPPGSVVVQHFDSTTGARHETHVYRAKGKGTFDAAAYRWRTDQSAADLVTHAEIVELPGGSSLQWFSPGPEPVFDPQFAIAGFVLQLNARQLNRGTQLRDWRERGWIDSNVTDEQLAAWPKLAGLDDADASLDHRVRSYLDANCAICHRPGGPSRGLFDARFTSAPEDDRSMIGGPLVAGDLGVPGAKVVDPGRPENSALVLRMKRTDAFRMPPTAVNLLPSPAVPLVEEWIRSLAPALPQPARTVTLAPDAVDESAGGLSAYQIETANATYYLEKSGAGLSSLIDRDGNDWISFHPEPGSGAAGEYRGFPNAVHQQAGNYFHPRNKATDPAVTEVVRSDADHVTITARSESGHWAGRYDFTADACTFTMTAMPPDRKFWALYEGVPGGSYDASDWWMTSVIAEKHPMARRHDGDIPAPEWIAFGDADMNRAIVLVHHHDDPHPDQFYQMQHKMTVFGFGRAGLDKFLDSVPRSISIGFVESARHADISKAAATISAAPR